MGGTIKKFVNKGYFTLVCGEAIKFLKKNGVNYFCMWTNEKNKVIEIFTKYANIIDTKENLTKIEIELRREYHKCKNIKDNTNINYRRYINLYKMKNGSTNDGLFFCFTM